MWAMEWFCTLLQGGWHKPRIPLQFQQVTVIDVRRGFVNAMGFPKGADQ